MQIYVTRNKQMECLRRDALSELRVHRNVHPFFVVDEKGHERVAAFAAKAGPAELDERRIPMPVLVRRCRQPHGLLGQDPVLVGEE